VGLVLGQHDRLLGQLVELLVQVGQDLVAVGVVFGDQPRSPPGRDLTDASVQGVQADGGVAQVPVEQRDGPGARLGQEPADTIAQPWAAEAGSARSGSVAKAVGAVGVVAMHPAAHDAWVAAQQFGDGGRRPAVVGKQDHDQAAAHPVGAVQQGEQVAGVASRAGALGVHAGGRILAQPREVVVVVSSNGPRGYFVSGPPSSQLRTEVRHERGKELYVGRLLEAVLCGR
jgi:hypothetical protein